MKNAKKFLALGLAGITAVSMTACGGGQKKTDDAAQAGENEKKEADGENSGGKKKIVISCGLADESQTAVRKIYLDEPLKKAFPDIDIEFKMYNDRQSLQVEVARCV